MKICPNLIKCFTDGGFVGFIQPGLHLITLTPQTKTYHGSGNKDRSDTQAFVTACVVLESASLFLSLAS